MSACVLREISWLKDYVIACEKSKIHWLQYFLVYALLIQLTENDECWVDFIARESFFIIKVYAKKNQTIIKLKQLLHTDYIQRVLSFFPSWPRTQGLSSQAMPRYLRVMHINVTTSMQSDVWVIIICIKRNMATYMPKSNLT